VEHPAPPAALARLRNGQATKGLAILPDDKNTLKLKMSAEAYLAMPPPSGWDGVTIYDTK
jgi:hypothetical protein